MRVPSTAGSIAATCRRNSLRRTTSVSSPTRRMSGRPRPGGLWPHQWDALTAGDLCARGGANAHCGAMAHCSTSSPSGGKTALIAATMVWLRLAHHVQRFLILCPNLIVRDRLEADFRNGDVFTERGLIPPDAIVSADDFALTTLGGASKATPSALFGAKVVLANIHQFYQSSATGQRNLWGLAAGPTRRRSRSSTTRRTTPPHRSYDRTLETLQDHGGCRFRLDTTATPDRADGKAVDSRMIYEYDIPAALHDRVIATPVVYEPNIETVELTYTDAEDGGNAPRRGDRLGRGRSCGAQRHAVGDRPEANESANHDRAQPAQRSKAQREWPLPPDPLRRRRLQSGCAGCEADAHARLRVAHADRDRGRGRAGAQ